MGGRTVTDPEGATWKVGRQWLPERIRVTRDDVADIPSPGGEGGHGGGLADVGFADDAIGVLLLIGLVVALVLFVFTVVWPLLALTIELVVIVVLFLAGLAGRLLFRRPWTIRARNDRSRRQLTWQAVGFRRSGRVRDEVAQALASGRTDIRPPEAHTP